MKYFIFILMSLLILGCSSNSPLVKNTYVIYWTNTDTDTITVVGKRSDLRYYSTTSGNYYIIDVSKDGTIFYGQPMSMKWLYCDTISEK